MVNGFRPSETRGLNGRRASKSHLGSRVQQETSEEGWSIYRPKRYEYKNKDEDNSPKTMNDKKQVYLVTRCILKEMLNLIKSYVTESITLIFLCDFFVQWHINFCGLFTVKDSC